MPNNKKESLGHPDDQMSVPKELSSKRLLQYIPGLDRIHAIKFIRRAYVLKRIATGKQIDNSMATGLHHGPHPSRHHRPQQETASGSQHRLHHRPHHGLHLCSHHSLHLWFDIIYTPLG